MWFPPVPNDEVIRAPKRLVEAAKPSQLQVNRSKHRELSLKCDSGNAFDGARIFFAMHLHSEFEFCEFSLVYMMPRKVRQPVATVTYSLHESTWQEDRYDPVLYAVHHQPLDGTSPEEVLQAIGRSWNIRNVSSIRLQFAAELDI
jgi:hypothetical protein